MPNILTLLIHPASDKHENLAAGQVVPEPGRCVQCGICTYNCPANIDVRQHARQGIPVQDRHCLTCGECILRCPRGVLHFEQTPLARLGDSR